MAETQPQTAPPVTQSDPIGPEQPGVSAAPQMESVAPPNLTQANLPAYGEPGAAEQPSTVVPVGQPVAQPAKPVKHAALLAMVQGLSDGLAGFSAGMASKGKISGAEVVQGLEAQRQQARQSASAEARAQQDADLRNKLTTAQTNQVLTQTHLLNASLQDEMSLKHTQAQEEATKFAGEQFNLFAGTGMNPDQIASLVTGGPTDAKTSNMLQANAQQNYRIAEQLLPPNNPSLLALKGLLADPTTSPATLVQANNRLQSELKGQEGVNDAKIKAATVAATAPFGDKAADLNAALLQRYQVLNPKATELPQGYTLDANSTAKDFDRVDKIMQQTENADATKANRDVVNGMREQMLDLAKGAKIPGDETKTGPEYLATLPVGLQGTIKEIGEGRGAPPPAGSRSPAAQTILGALNRAYPDYDASKYPTYLKARTAFTSGPEGKGVNALNTVETHLARMYQHANAPGTSGGLTGKVTGFFGDKDVRALDIDRTAVATELSKAYAAGQISEGEVKDWEAKLDFTTPGMTTGKLIQNLKEIDGLLEGKQKAYQQQWATASPSASIVSPVPIISSEASAARAKIRGEAAASAPHVIQVGPDQYVYNGSGDTADLKNYTKK